MTVGPEAIAAEVAKLKGEGHRFVTMTCVDLDEVNAELIYHFDKDLALSHLRMTVAKKSPVPSISGVYFAAFLVENEIQDQFGLKFDGLALDFGGTLYLDDDEEVMRTPFCKYGVVRKGGAAKAATEAGAEKSA